MKLRYLLSRFILDTAYLVTMSTAGFLIICNEIVKGIVYEVFTKKLDRKPSEENKVLEFKKRN